MAVCDRVTESVRIYVMWPFSYSRCAVDIVYFAEKPSLRDASCCSVVVRNGAYGERRYGLRSTLLTVKGTPVSRFGQAGAGLWGTTPPGGHAFPVAPGFPVGAGAGFPVGPCACKVSCAFGVLCAFEVEQAGVAEFPGGREIAALRHPAAVHRRQPAGE